jgi:3-dehydroquinate synthetase
MLIELKISEYLGYYNKPIEQIIYLLEKYNLPTSYEKYLSNHNIKKLIEKIKYDKKASDNNINIICIDEKGGFIKELSFQRLEKILTKLK